MKQIYPIIYSHNKKTNEMKNITRGHTKSAEVNPNF